MAFVSSTLPTGFKIRHFRSKWPGAQSPLNDKSQNLKQSSQNRVYQRQAPTSLTRSHSYGNGGLDNRLDWSDFDPEEMARQVAEAEYMYKANPIVHTTSPWTILMGLDLIQVQNNLVEAARQYGFQWDLSEISVERLADATAVREIQEKHETIWQVIVDEAPVSFSLGPEGDGPVCFFREEEATRFAEQYTADGGGSATAVEVNTLEVRKECDARGGLIGIIPCGTLVTPAMLGGVPQKPV